MTIFFESSLGQQQHAIQAESPHAARSSLFFVSFPILSSTDIIRALGSNTLDTDFRCARLSTVLKSSPFLVLV